MTIAVLYIIALSALSAAGFDLWQRKSKAGRRLAQMRQLHQLHQR